MILLILNNTEISPYFLYGLKTEGYEVIGANVLSLKFMRFLVKKEALPACHTPLLRISVVTRFKVI